ncbi:NAD-dependent epimerase [Cohnella sp. REN36]|uniref:NAD-dependent epimerase n=1 Tax=Cohnella sp. REN36 TaxID=2887347 RepID=UPI001D1543B6|nr:NAD-dependent epimerase [Cohnella sp. REN36]MCC3375554.1 NAD-dependent epimerase [Cohnella sp. REN36]
MTIVVTGAAGFIGYHLAARLLLEGKQVVGIDNMNDYYDVRLKEDRLARIADHPNFTFHRLDVADAAALEDALAGVEAEAFIHLAAQAGVRYSLQNPRAYIDANLVGFGNVLEWCRHHRPAHLIYASSSSVYGMNETMPFSVHDNVDHPVSLYAATKKANELMAHSYSHLYGIPTSGLRFFTVYGPWGRPDMAYFSFTQKIREGRPIEVFNEGRMQRDFTYVDDIVEGIFRLIPVVPAPNPDWDRRAADPGTSSAPYRVYNIGNHQPVELMTMIRTIEEAVGREAVIDYKPMQPGDVTATYADIADLQRATGFAPSTPIEEGLRRFVAWHNAYYEEREMVVPAT